ncbi:MAG: choice-of-anchor J domain-containing protein [Anaerolineales bacterium]
MGTGRIDLTQGALIGLVMDESVENYENANPFEGGEPKTLNQPSMVDQNCVGECSWTRTLRSVLDVPATYDVITEAPAGMTITVIPDSFTIAAGATQELEINVSIDLDVLPTGDWAFAQIHLETGSQPMIAQYGDFVELGESYDHDTAWAEKTHDISPYEGQDVCLAFVYEAVDGHTWFIDDILVTSDLGVHLDESFTDETFPPDGWSIYELGSNPHRQWARTTSNPNTPPAAAWHDWTFSTNHDDNWLVTPQFTLGDNAEFTYYDRMGFITWYNYSGVWISTGSCDPTPVLDTDVAPVRLPIAVIPTLDVPIITVDPDEMSATQAPGEVTTQTLTIGNEGFVDLNWTISEAEPLALAAGDETASTVPFRPDEAASDLVSELGMPLPFGLSPIMPADVLVVDCEVEPGIIIHDDGTIENGYSGNPDVVNQVIFVDPFTPSSYPASFTAVCVSLVSLGTTTLDFDIVLYADDGPGGAPGTELGSLPVSASDIPIWPAPVPVWNAYDISSLEVSIDAGSVYIGVRYAPPSPNVFIAADESTTTPLTGGYWWNDNAGVWAPIQTAFAGYRALFVRAVADVPPSACESPTDVPWLSVEPDSGITSPGGSDEVTVTFDSTGVEPGVYDAFLCVISDDPVNPLVEVSVTLEVIVPIDPPVIDVDPDSLAFTLPVGSQAVDMLTISNLGISDLVWDIFEDNSPAGLLTNWMDDFDSYETGSQLHGQGGWKGWFNDPSAGALTSDAQANSAPNSAAILGASDLVHEYDGYTSGAWVYKAMQFVPYGFIGQSYFILLNSYDDAGSNLNWSVQVLFNGDTNQVSNTGVSGGTLPLIRGNWVELRVEIDLNADTQAFYYNNQLLYMGTWTSEVSGGGVLNIGAVDLYANGASVVYYDDMSLAFMSPIVDAWKEAPDFAEPGEVIPYTITIEATMLMDGMYMVDPLPEGVEFAGNLTWTDGDAWYDAGDNTVYWEYAELVTAGEPTSPGVYDPDAVADLVGAVEPSGAPLPEGDVKTFSYPLSVLWDNGPQVTHPGGGYNGHAASALQSAIGLNTYGFGNQFALGYRMADDFEITDPSGWWIDTVTFFAYQTATYPYPPGSTFTGIYFQIWDGPPNDPGSSIVWGDLTTNRLVETAWPEIYRVLDTAMLNTQRPTMANVAEAGLWLPPGTYWLDWTTDGSGASGPWAPPITILGETTTGNAMQYTTAWASAVDTGLSTPQGMPFIIAGEVGFEPVLIEVSFDVTVTGLHGDLIVNEGWAGIVEGPEQYFEAVTEVVGTPGINVDPLELSAEVVIDTTAMQTLNVCSVGTAPLEWDLIIAADPIMMSVLIIQDQYPWGFSSIQDILTTKGIAYDQIDSLQIPAVDLSPYVLVIVPSDQPSAFYTTWNDNLAKFEDYVENGGALWLSTATFTETDPEPLLPGGVIKSLDLDEYNDILEPTHPWVAGVPDPMHGNFASHDSFTNLYPGSVVVTQAQTSHNPTLVDYSLGDGRILITGQTLEFAWAYDWDGAPILPNSLLDMYYWAVASDIPWLSEDLNTGELLPGECQEVKMTFDTTGMDLGDYSANLLIFSNDPLNPISMVPVELIVVAPEEFFIYLPVAMKN